MRFVLYPYYTQKINYRQLFLGDIMDTARFLSGNMFDAYKYMGCHICYGGAFFRVYAPNAKKVTLTGDFNLWGETEMTRTYLGFWEVFSPEAKVGMMYKYKVYYKDTVVDHCDPYCFAMEKLPGFASVIYDTEAYRFDDKKWMDSRTDCKDKPLNIYEVHAGSWKKPEGGCYSYRELAEKLIPYVKNAGYNYIEFMPLSEYPCDSSWGYQGTGFYSPTSRYGDPDELKFLVDNCHKNGIGVILDYVPVHFAIDYYGLAYFDGSHLYEYPNDAIGYNEWGSKNFNHARGEVRSFLKSAANYFLTEYHFDGIRIDALSNIIYWQGRGERGENRQAVNFIRELNSGLKGLHPTAILAAEDSTSYPGVTKPVPEGGLGFDYKWAMGWMHDTLDYFKAGVGERKSKYHKLTFSMIYFYNENYIMPLSHDEVVHGKATIMQKMHGLYGEKFQQARAMYLYMYAHPGKKLNFMGNEIGQLREWDETREQDWDMLKYPMHDSFALFMRELSNIYLSTPALYERDHEYGGFSWIDCEQKGDCAYAFNRWGESDRLIALFNFSYEEKVYALELDSDFETLIDSDWDKYSGNSKTEKKIYKKGKTTVRLAPFSGKYLVKK